MFKLLIVIESSLIYIIYIYIYIYIKVIELQRAIVRDYSAYDQFFIFGKIRLLAVE
jgi:hypothetical protein